MSWSYSGNPSSSNLDKVRFLIGDTDTTDQQLSDEEITSMLADNSDNPYAAAIACAEGLVSKFSRKVQKSVGDLSISYGETANNYRTLLGDLRRKASIQLCTPYAGGISISDKETDEEDSDLVKPAFTRDMHDIESPNDEDSDWLA